MKHEIRNSKLPFQIELVITLISEDFRKRKFFIEHYDLDFDADPWVESDLGNIVLQAVGFNKPTDADLNFYSELIHQNCRPKQELEMDEAFHVYMELIRCLNRDLEN